jgi:Glycosyltransferase family 87
MSQPDAAPFRFVSSPVVSSPVVSSPVVSSPVVSSPVGGRAVSSRPAAVASSRAEQFAYRALLAAAAVGVLARVVVIAISSGSNDMATWAQFAEHINAKGLWQTYRDIEYFNHPPLMGLLAAGFMKLSVWLHVPFRVLWKLPPLAADLCALRLLWGCFRPRGKLWAAGAVALFSINPISISVTAFHGNTDSVCALLCLCAALLHRRHQPFLAGLGLAAAINVKVFPLVLAPGFLLLCSNPRAALRFLLGLGLGCVPLAVACAVVPKEFVDNTLRYNSQLDRWGVNAWALDAQAQYPHFFRLITEQYRRIGRFVILVVAGLFALLGRSVRWDAVRVAALSLAAFLFFAPGFGVQYLVWPVPLLAAASLEYSVWWAVLGGSFTVLLYQSFLIPYEWPLRSDHVTMVNPTIGLLGLCAWAVLGFYMYAQLRDGLGDPEFIRIRRRAGHWLATMLRRSA